MEPIFYMYLQVPAVPAPSPFTISSDARLALRVILGCSTLTSELAIQAESLKRNLDPRPQRSTIYKLF
jgi:hypothetical protein